MVPSHFDHLAVWIQKRLVSILCGTVFYCTVRKTILGKCLTSTFKIPIMYEKKTLA
jgi:hypothetical protein